MALLKKRTGEIPADAVILTEDEAIKYQLKIITTWKNKSDTLAFRYGASILSGAAVISSIYLNNHYRTKFKLFSYGRLSSYLPVCFLPPVISFIAHTEFVLKDIILQKTPCPVCVEMRSAALQSLIGVVFPALLAPLSAIGLALKYGTYDIPYIHKEPKKLFNLWRSKTKPIINVLFAIFLGHALLGSAIAYFEAKSVISVNRKLSELEYNLEHNDVGDTI